MTPALSVNIFTAPEKAVLGERPRPFGPPMAFDPMTSTLIIGDNDAVLIDTLATAAEAEALANWVAMHHRNLPTIYITHGHIDHFAGFSVLLQRFPGARAIATPKSVELMRKQSRQLPFFRNWWPGQLPAAITLPEPYDGDASAWRATSCSSSSGAAPTPDTTSLHVPRSTSWQAATGKLVSVATDELVGRNLPAWAGEDDVCDSCSLPYAHTTIDDAVQAIHALPAQLRAAIDAAPAGARRQRPGPSTWPVAEYACHIRDVLISSTIRLHRGRTETETAAAVDRCSTSCGPSCSAATRQT